MGEVGDSSHDENRWDSTIAPSPHGTAIINDPAKVVFVVTTPFVSRTIDNLQVTDGAELDFGQLKSTVRPIHPVPLENPAEVQQRRSHSRGWWHSTRNSDGQERSGT